MSNTIIIRAEVRDNQLRCMCVGAPEESEYAFYIYKDNEIIKKRSYHYNASYTYKLDEQGEYYVKVFVRSGQEKRSYKSSLVRYVQESVKLELTGQNRLFCKCSGMGEDEEFAFYVIKDGEEYDRISYQKNAHYTYWPMEAGTYQVKIFIRNKTGKRVAYTN